jgi:hypothetical protein
MTAGLELPNSSMGVRDVRCKIGHIANCCGVARGDPFRRAGTGCDYHKAQPTLGAEAGRRQPKAAPGTTGKQGFQAVAYKTPLTTADRNRFLPVNRRDYDHLVRREG